MLELLKAFARWYRLVVSAGRGSGHVFLLLMRLYFGWTFFQAGWGKLANIDQAASNFKFWDVPLPLFNAYAAGLTEGLFGIMLLVGFLGRLTAIPLIVVMVVAYLTAHKHEVSSVADFVAAPPFKHLIASLSVFCFGPGFLSCDGAIRRWCLPGAACPSEVSNHPGTNLS